MPSFITNRDFVPSLMVFMILALIVHGIQWLAINQYSNLGFISAVIIFIFMAEWELHARHTFGRQRPRAHFENLDILKLPPHKPQLPNFYEIDPLTPYVEENIQRMDEAALLKHAHHTMTGGDRPSALESAIVNLMEKSKEKSIQDPSTPF